MAADAAAAATSAAALRAPTFYRLKITIAVVVSLSFAQSLPMSVRSYIGLRDLAEAEKDTLVYTYIDDKSSPSPHPQSAQIL
ncbi:hypothetical protein U1Q18_052049, partial [Sarracenia purpurea var. burkii]